MEFLPTIHKNLKVAEAVMWSAKESTYKSQFKGRAIFNPKQFEIKKGLGNSLEVHYQGKSTFVEYVIEEEYVFTQTINSTNCSSGNHGFVQIKKTEGDESLEVRKNIYSYLNRHFEGDWEVRRSQYGKPYLACDNKVSEKIISISHHKPFIAFVLR